MMKGGCVIFVMGCVLYMAYAQGRVASNCLVRFEEGQGCNKRKQNIDGCDIFTAGQKELVPINNDHAWFDFQTTENKGSEPLTVQVALSGLYIDTSQKHRAYVSGIVNILQPNESTGAMLWVLEGKKQRMERYYFEEDNKVFYRWFEISVSGEPAPETKATESKATENNAAEEKTEL